MATTSPPHEAVNLAVTDIYNKICWLSLSRCRDVADYGLQMVNLNQELRSVHQSNALPVPFLITLFMAGLGEEYKTWCVKTTTDTHFIPEMDGDVGKLTSFEHVMVKAMDMERKMSQKEVAPIPIKEEPEDEHRNEIPPPDTIERPGQKTTQQRQENIHAPIIYRDFGGSRPFAMALAQGADADTSALIARNANVQLVTNESRHGRALSGSGRVRHSESTESAQANVPRNRYHDRDPDQLCDMHGSQTVSHTIAECVILNPELKDLSDKTRQPNKELHVRNLPANATKQTLRDIFDAFGYVSSSFARRKGRTWARVMLADGEEATAAMKAKRGILIGGCVIDIDYVDPTTNPKTGLRPERSNSHLMQHQELTQGAPVTIEEDEDEYQREYRRAAAEMQEADASGTNVDQNGTIERANTIVGLADVQRKARKQASSAIGSDVAEASVSNSRPESPEPEKCTLHGGIPALHTSDDCWSVHPERMPDLVDGRKPSLVLLIHAIDTTVTKDMIERKFRRYGATTTAIARNGTFAHVRFNNAQDAEHARQRRHGRTFSNGVKIQIMAGKQRDPSLRYAEAEKKSTTFSDALPSMITMRNRFVLPAAMTLPLQRPTASTPLFADGRWRRSGYTPCTAHPGIPHSEVLHSADYCPLLGIPETWRSLTPTDRAARERYWEEIQSTMPEKYKILAIDDAINRMQNQAHTKAFVQWYFDQWMVPGCEQPQKRPTCISEGDWAEFWKRKKDVEAEFAKGKTAADTTNTQFDDLTAMEKSSSQLIRYSHLAVDRQRRGQYGLRPPPIPVPIPGQNLTAWKERDFVRCPRKHFGIPEFDIWHSEEYCYQLDTLSSWIALEPVERAVRQAYWIQIRDDVPSQMAKFSVEHIIYRTQCKEYAVALEEYKKAVVDAEKSAAKGTNASEQGEVKATKRKMPSEEDSAHQDAPKKRKKSKKSSD